MKRILTVLVLCLMLLPAAVFAQDETVYLNWESTIALDGAEELAATGDFFMLEKKKKKMWLPSDLKPEELTEEDIANGFIHYFSSEDGSKIVAVVMGNANGATLDSWKEELSAMDDVSGITDVVINGIPAVGYDIEDKDLSCATFITEDGDFVEFSFKPMSDKEFAPVTLMILSSIQGTDEEGLSFIDWEESKKAIEEADVKGEFVTFDQLNAKVWIPDIYKPLELDEEDLANGMIGYYETEFEDGTYGAILVSYDDYGITSAEEYVSFLLEKGYETAELVNLNGWKAAMYSSFDEEFDYACVSLATEAGKIFEVAVHPVSTDAYLGAAYIILSSVQAED